MHTGDWRRLHMEDLTTSEFQWLWDKNVELTICMGRLTHTGVNRKRIHDSNRNWGQFITLQLWKMVKCGYPHQHVHPIGPFDMITCILQTSFLSVILHYNVQFFYFYGTPNPLSDEVLVLCWVLLLLYISSSSRIFDNRIRSGFRDSWLWEFTTNISEFTPDDKEDTKEEETGNQPVSTLP